MEMEGRDRRLIGEKEREALVYSFDILRVALSHGWRIKIFQVDKGLSYLENTLKDIEVDPNAFFLFKEFRLRKDVYSAYDWAREVQKVAYESYNTQEIEDEEFIKNLETLDQAYKEDIDPWKVLTKEELVNTDNTCKRYIDTLYSLT